MGKVMIMGQRGESVPSGWAVDHEGRETRVLAEVRALLPAAGAKDYGLGAWVDVLAGVLSGASFGRDIGNMYRDFDRPQDVGHFVLALKVAYFLAGADFEARLARLGEMLTAAQPAPGVHEVLLQ